MGRRPGGCRRGGVSAPPRRFAPSGHPGRLLLQGGEWPRTVQGTGVSPTFARTKTLHPQAPKAGDGIGMVLLGCSGLRGPAPSFPSSSHAPPSKAGCTSPLPPTRSGDSPGPLALLLFFRVPPRPLAFLSQARYVYLIIELLEDWVSLGP